MDPDIRRETQIASEQLEAWKDAELDRLWGVYGDEIPYNDAGQETARASSEEIER